MIGLEYRIDFVFCRVELIERYNGEEVQQFNEKLKINIKIAASR